MVKKSIRQKLLIWLLAVVLATAGIFTILIHRNIDITKETASQLGSMYMSEMMYQMQNHFQSIVSFKNQEALHVSMHAEEDTSNPRDSLIMNAEHLGFEYLAFYDDLGNYETILGETAWYRNLSGFISLIKDEKPAATTGYLTSSGEKYIVFGVPCEYDMSSGGKCSVLLLGFSVNKIPEFIDIENMDQFGTDAKLDIILTNGSYVINHQAAENISYFDHILQYGHFVGTDTSDGIAQIEKSMASGESFSYTVKLNGVTEHIYGAPAGNPGDWYFVLSMPQSTTDVLLNKQNTEKLWWFCLAALFIFVLFLAIFLIYHHMALKQINETEAAKNDAEIANNAKSRFLSNMSHDIRTPMNAIIGFTNLALQIQGNPDETTSYLHKINSSGNHLLVLINEVLEMSRIESGKVELVDEISSITDMFENLKSVFEANAHGKRQSFDMDVHVTDDFVHIDVLRVTQVMQNIIANAIKYTPEGGCIAVSACQIPCDKAGWGAYKFVVTDNGMGMSEEFAQKAFQPFEREFSSHMGKIEGTGLGLSIVKHIIDVMEGRIEFETEQRKGSTFTVYLNFPLAEPSLIDAYKQKNQENEPSPDGADALANLFTDKRILLAEDNDFNREIASAILTGAGFHVETAEDGQVVISMLTEKPVGYYDVILMDIQMPNMDGYEATRTIRSLPDARSETRIVAVTANAFESDRKAAEEAGMNGHVAKPIDVGDLYRVLQKIL